MYSGSLQLKKDCSPEFLRELEAWHFSIYLLDQLRGEFKAFDDRKITPLSKTVHIIECHANLGKHPRDIIPDKNLIELLESHNGEITQLCFKSLPF